METKVPFTMENGKKCICTKCPVQEKSECVKMKKEMMMKMMENMKEGEEMMMPKPEDVPGLYCSAGKASCTDIDTTQMCICMQCPVWSEFKLADGKPMGYFCRDGMAM